MDGTAEDPIKQQKPDSERQMCHMFSLIYGSWVLLVCLFYRYIKMQKGKWGGRKWTGKKWEGRKRRTERVTTNNKQ